MARRAHRDRLPGGLADKLRPEDFDPKQLRRGVKVELEHTDDPEIAREIAMDHLAEDENYYEMLDAMERRLALSRASANPTGCDACYQENQLGGAGTALIIGGLAILGLFLFTRRVDAAPATTAPTACAIDVQKLDQWGAARGFPVIYLPRASTPPTHNELLETLPLLQQYANTSTQIVVVLGDGSFWWYIDPDALPAGLTESTGRADNLRADYCEFPSVEPPRTPPPPPSPGTTGLGQQATDYGARQFFYWNSRRQQWDLIATYAAPLPGNVLQHVRHDFRKSSELLRQRQPLRNELARRSALDLSKRKMGVVQFGHAAS